MANNQLSFEALKSQMITATETLYHSHFDAARDYLKIIAKVSTVESKEALFRTAILLHGTQPPLHHKRKMRQTRAQKAEQGRAEERLKEVVGAWANAAILTNAPLADTARALWRSVSLQGADAVFAFGLLLRSNAVPYVQIPADILEYVRPEDVYAGAISAIQDKIALYMRIQGISRMITSREFALAVSRIIRAIDDEVELCAFVDFVLKNTGFHDDSVVPDV